MHYGQVVERFAAELAARRFGLLEALAEHLAGIVIGEFKAPWVRLSVAKLGHIRNVRKVGVTIERPRASRRSEPAMLKWVLVIVVAVVVLSFFAPQFSQMGLGRLPGDITVRFRGRLVYLPITTTVLISLALTALGRIV